MRLYLPSFRNGNQPGELIKLLGSGRRTALIHNAMDAAPAAVRADSLKQEIDRLKSLGLDPVELDLREFFDQRPGLAQRLEQFDLVWARGGNSFVLRRAFKQSGADQAIVELLKGDRIVYGGYSAGIDMLTPSLHGIELVDDPHDVPQGYRQEVIWDGLGLLPYAIAPHYKSDHPESAAVDKSVEYLIDHHLPFIALRDGEVIVVDGTVQRILG